MQLSSVDGPCAANTMTSSANPSQPEPAKTTSSQPAASVYRERIAVLQGKERALHREHLWLGWIRLAFGIAIVLLLLPPKLPVLLALACFAVAARIHQRILRRLAEIRRTLAFHEHGLARTEDRWAGLHPRPTRLDFAGSLYATDLDVFGPGSLFELICEARTSPGEDTLATWLLAPSLIPELRRRQEAVADLRDRLALREAFAAAPGPALAMLDRAALAAWGETSGPELPEIFRWLVPLLVVLTFGAAWRYAAAGTPLLLILMLLIDVSLTFAYKRTFESLFVGAEQASRSLATLGVLLQHIEASSFSAGDLIQNQSSLTTAGTSASAAIAKLARGVRWTEARGNYLVRIVDAPLLYSLQLALSLQRWRRQYGTQLRSWLDILGQFEALLSLAGYSYEHPADPFPLFRQGTGDFVATGLGHPLLPAAQCVRNDVSLSKGTQLLLVSGSNMSGKSTLLRSVGINAVLAFAGGPVRAHSLALSPLTIAASIQVSDSLQAGRSRFYAEILRLRSIAHAARTEPVLFLIDEVLAGTNSSDRLAGARGLVRDLLGHNAIGLMSTHDLAITALSAGEEQAICNVHFEDEVIEGQLHFDYRLRAGVVERSNGLALMRMIGLDV